MFGAHSGQWAVRVKKVQSEMCAVSPAANIFIQFPVFSVFHRIFVISFFFFIGQFQCMCVFSVLHTMFFLSFSFFFLTVSVCVHCSVCCTRCSRFVGSQLVLCRQTHIYIGDLALAALGKQTDMHTQTDR